MNSEKNLEQHLEVLFEESVALAKESLQNKSLRLRYVPHVRETLRVDTGTFTQISSVTTDLTAKCEFHREDMSNLLDRIKQLSSYKYTMELVDALDERTNRSPKWIICSMITRIIEETLLIPLESFYDTVQSNLHGILDGSLEVENLRKKTVKARKTIEKRLKSARPRSSDYSLAAANELLNRTKLYKVKMWLTGLWVEGDVIEGERFVLRTPTEEDMTVTYSVGDPPIWGKQPNRIVPTSVLEIDFEAVDQPKISRKISRMMISLMLYRGSIDYWKYIAIPDSVDCNADVMGNLNAKHTSGVSVSSKNLDDLSFHLIELPAMIPDEMMKGRFRQETGLAVAYHMYEEAIRKKFTPQDYVNNSVIGLESMYLRLDYERDKGPRLSRLVASVLKDEGFSETEVKQNIRLAYKKIRNKMSHGAPLDDEERFLSVRLAEPLLQYLRMSIVILLKRNRQDFFGN